MHKYLFVYGTLKTGRPNHFRMKGATFLGTAITREKYPLVIGGQHYTPYLLNFPGVGFQIQGEIYRISPAHLKEMDAFERAPTYYNRLPLRLLNWSLDSPCYAYFKTSVEQELLASQMLPTYPLDHRYIPAWKRKKVSQ